MPAWSSSGTDWRPSFPRRETPILPPQWTKRSGAPLDAPPKSPDSEQSPNGYTATRTHSYSLDTKNALGKSPSASFASDTTVEDRDLPEPAQIRSDILSPDNPQPSEAEKFKKSSMASGADKADKARLGGPSGTALRHGQQLSREFPKNREIRRVSAEPVLDNTTRRPTSAGSASATHSASRVVSKPPMPILPPKSSVRSSVLSAMGKDDRRGRGPGSLSPDAAVADRPSSSSHPAESLKRATLVDSSDSDGSDQVAPARKRLKMRRSLVQPVPRVVSPAADQATKLSSSPRPTSTSTSRQAVPTVERSESRVLRFREAESEDESKRESGAYSESSSDEDILNSRPQTAAGDTNFDNEGDSNDTIYHAVAPGTTPSTPELVDPGLDEMKGAETGKRMARSRPAVPIEMAEPDRSYRKYQVDGVLVGTNGALMPANYEFSGLPDFPWACAVRDCRRSFFALQGLGKHFGVAHRGLHLNDNGDGTLTEVARPAQFAGQQSVVVSQITRSQDELGPVATCAPYKKNASRPSLPNGHSAPGTPTPSFQSDPEAMMRYLRPFLHQPDLDAAFKNQHVQQCLELPKVRDIEWNTERIAKTPFRDTLPRDISSLIIQITGDVAGFLCSNCMDGTGPYKDCVLISREAPEELQQHITSCANCRYKGRAATCTLVPMMKERHYLLFPDAKGVAVGGPVGKRTARGLPSRNVDHGTNGDSRDGGVDGDGKGRPGRRSERVVARDSLAVPDDGPSRAGVSGRQKGQSIKPFQPRSFGRSESGKSGPSREIVALSRQETRVAPHQDFSPEDLQMQDWEVAPGYLRRGTGGLEHMAFSNAFLTSNHTSVPIDHGVTFQVLLVLPGGVHTFDAAPSRRWCSVAGGKVSVRLNDEQEFVMGPNGLFKVGPGDTCVVKNRHYIQATLHLSAMSGG